MLGFYNYTVILTYLSLCSGITGIWFCTMVDRWGNRHPGIAVICLLISGLCDAFDGRIARMRKESTDQEKRFGIQIDSLCDLICFGVLPCCIGYAVGMTHPLYVPVFCAFVLAALIRLAYFNVSEEDRQKQTTEKRKSYQGLPVTSSSLIFPFFFLAMFTGARPYMQYIWLGVLLITALLFVFESLKIRKPSFKGILFLIFIGAVELAILLVLKALT